MPQLDVSSWPGQILWLALTFALLYLVLARRIAPRIQATLDKRRRHIQDLLAAAERSRDEASRRQQAYQKAIGKARSEAQAILNQGAEELAEHSERRRQQLDDELEKKLVAAESRIQDQRRQALAEVSLEAAQLAEQTASRLLERSP